ncbi:MAG TPA: hypothetical protein VJ840_16545 [Gemmatimonadaceae bacterium]|nr:hypothetical protein [Gemmatimonadaceae bacterium]
MDFSRRIKRGTLLMAALSLLVTESLAAQEKTRVVQRIGQDTVLVIPGEDFRAGSFHRRMLGDEWRDEWTTPIKVPVLNLATVHGGLKPTKEGGGFQAPNLHFVAADGSEWVFRMLKKIRTNLDPDFDHTVIEWIFRDQGAASHPTALMAAAPMLEAARVLHPSPKLYYMPDDPALGEHRKTFAGVLGELEERPEVPDKGPAFAGAEKIIDSDTLLARINADAKTQIDARQLLTARLMDILFGDNDRHPEQWEWARLSKDDNALWQPIATDRDKVFVNYEGLLLSVARMVEPSLVTFRPSYPDPSALSAIAVEFDRRLLGSLGKATWDSVANSLMQRITDPVIDNAVAQMPPEYARYSAGIATRLKARRNGLRSVADRYYSQLWRVADVHGTDADDQLNVMRVGDGMVDVVLQSDDKPYFARRFYASETKEIRIYLHGGDDQAVIDGHVRTSIPVRVIGGNGSNTIRDISTVGGRASPTRIYDQGPVTSVKYARDTLDEKAGFDMAFNRYFNRRPWVKAYGTLIPPVKDRGGSMRPILGIHSQHALGIYPVIGLKRYTYGFRKVPYAMKQQADFSYATSGRIRIRAAVDKRFESSDTHIPITGHFSQFEVAQFHGFGNDVPDLRGLFYSVRQKQWEIFPAIAHSFNPESDVSFGPILRYTTTDSIANRFITQLHPTGFSTYGQTGLQLKLHLDSRYYPDSLKPRFVVDLAGAGYPGMWDVNTPYQSLDGWGAAFFTIPMAKKPVLAFRAGGKKLWGDFPYFDAAFLGGSETYRVESKQRWAGDASLYGSSELRVPIAQFPLVLPLDVGAIAFADMGRVYFNGDSPDGWHTAAGGGFWVGFRDPGKSVTVLFSNRGRHRVVTSFGFAY